MRTYLFVAMLGLALATSTFDVLASGAKSKDRGATPARGQIVRIGLVADLPQWPAAETGTARLFDLMHERKIAFVVHVGSIKGDTESCGDPLLGARFRLLDQAPLPVIYLPGEAEWAECHRPVNGSFDAVERLNRLREMFFPTDTSLGQQTLRLTRQSDQAMFRRYRENVRWSVGNVLLVGLNLPGDNNHYRSEGGRNGEFEDRREANHQWLARAFSVAKQQDMDGIVLLAHSDPQFENGWETRGKPSLLDGFTGKRPRDGYLEFKRQLRDLSVQYRGRVLVVHAGSAGFGTDHPLRDTNGKPLRHVTRVTLPTGSSRQWTQLTITPGAQALFSVALQDGTRDD